MDARQELQKAWKDLRASAREYASFGLETSSKALDFTAGVLHSLKDRLDKRAEDLAPKKESTEGNK